MTTNYIKHLNATFAKFYADERLSPFHISLYFALFQYWNLTKFRNPISITRHEVMQASKIGSANTYLRCLKELDTWSYIKYMPSYNPQVGSQIYLYNFNTTTDNATDISTDKTTDKGTDKTNDIRVRPSKNNTKQKINNTNILNLSDEQKAKNNFEFESNKNSGSNKKLQNGKEKKVPAKKRKPNIEEAKAHFKNQQWPELEAEKFYNYFESNGWLVGGKTPMQNWQASANNWMLNSTKFKPDGANKKTNSTNNNAGKLHATTGKDYSEPL